MKKYFCDKCGEEIGKARALILGAEETVVSRKMDLCTSCKQELNRLVQAWLQGGLSLDEDEYWKWMQVKGEN